MIELSDRAIARAVARRLIGSTALLVLLALAGCGGESATVLAPPVPTPTPAPTPAPPAPDAPLAPADGLGTITENDLRAIVEFLASEPLAGRSSGEGGDELAADFLAERFRAAGLPPENGQPDYLQPFPCTGTTRGQTFNVAAYVRGSDPAFANRPLVIGAHFDHLGIRDGQICPGADDNASGTAIVVELAEAFAALGSPPRRPIVLVAFGGEELGLLGSRHWLSTRQTDSPGYLPFFMINADMIGHVATGGLNVLGVSPWDGLAGQLRTFAMRRGVAEPRFSAASGGGSDHVPFRSANVPVAFLYTGPHQYYHTPADTPATLDFAGLTGVARITFELAWSLANAPVLPAPTLEPPPTALDWQADHGLIPFAPLVPAERPRQ